MNVLYPARPIVSLIALMLITGGGCKSTDDAVISPVETSDVADDVSSDIDDTSTPACEGVGCPGDLCSDDSQCQKGACVWHLGERVCSTPCDSGCPAFSECSDKKGACESSAPMLCRPCQQPSDCTGGACVDYGDQGSFCGASCAAHADCPGGYFCEQGNCRHGTGECSCTAAMKALEDATRCNVSNALGSCDGQRRCSTDGLTACDATPPADDVCDGVDNDCNGTTDTVECSDGNSCTIDSCGGESGCQHEADGPIPCDDGDDCTENDTCQNGTCSSDKVTCDDGDVCTTDTCVSGTGCLHVDNEICTCKVDADCPAPNNRCLGKVKCIATEENPFLHCEQDLTTAVNCDAPVGPNAQCLKVECEPATGLCVESFANEGGQCPVSSKCIAESVCIQGVCTVSQMTVCEDSNACTDNACDDAVGCVYTNNNNPCEIPEQCLENGECVEGKCEGNTDCDDNNPCTADTCVEGAGCIHVPSFGECALADPCVIKAACVDSVCTPVELQKCDDGEECTADVCKPNSGCVYIPTSPDCCTFGETPDKACYPPLTANAGPDITINKGETATLSAVATGGDKQYQFEWTDMEGQVTKGQVVEVTPAKPATYVLKVTDGLGNTAQDKVTVLVAGVPLTLCDWPVINIEPLNHTQPKAKWVFDNECTKATQTINAQPSILLSTIDFEQGTLSGQFYVNTKIDDDLIGFVFGYQSTFDFLLFDWKQKSQTFCGAPSFEGVILKHIQTNGAMLTCQDFFGSGGTEHTKILTPPKPPGWQENQAVPYQWTLTIKDAQATIWIHQGDTQIHKVSADLPGFSGGLFGFYNNSQDSVVYEVFQFVAPNAED